MKKDELSQIEIYAKQGKENVILYIKDNGIGIKKGEVTRVFEKASQEQTEEKQTKSQQE